MLSSQDGVVRGLSGTGGPTWGSLCLSSGLLGPSGRWLGGRLRGHRGADLPGDSCPRGLPAGHMLFCHRQLHEGPSGCRDALLQGGEERRATSISGETGPTAPRGPQEQMWGLVIWTRGCARWRRHQRSGGREAPAVVPGPFLGCPFSPHFVNFILGRNDFFYFLE